MRPLTPLERQVSWFYALVPVLAAYVVLLTVTYVITRPDLNYFLFLFDIGNPIAPATGREISSGLQMTLARGCFLVAYLTWSRSTGHMQVGGHVVDRRTGMPMRTWQRLVRGGAQMLSGTFYLVFDAISVVLVLLDKEERRSLYDWISGTVVVSYGPLPEDGGLPPGTGWLSRWLWKRRGGRPGE